MSMQDKKRVNVWIPKDLYSQLETLPFKHVTEAIVSTLESALEEQPKHPEEQSIIDSYRDKCVLMESHISTLQSEVEHLRELHNNYMLQMQSLINQRAIEAPGAKKPWWKVW